jgi:hypothetical protein
MRTPPGEKWRLPAPCGRIRSPLPRREGRGHFGTRMASKRRSTIRAHLFRAAFSRVETYCCRVGAAGIRNRRIRIRISFPNKKNISISYCAIDRDVTIMFIVSARGNNGFARFRQSRLRARLSEREARVRKPASAPGSLANVIWRRSALCLR